MTQNNFYKRFAMFPKPLFATLMIAGNLFGAVPALKLPEEVRGYPAAFITVPAQTDGKVVRWLVLDPGLNLFPTELLRDTKTAVVSSGVPGTYRIMAVTALADEPSVPVVCKVVVSKDNPPDPTPPGPAPPPDPDPVVPDSIGKSLKTAFDKDTTEEKAKCVKALAELYRQAPGILSQVTTAGQLRASLRQSAATLLSINAIPEVRKAIEVELKKVLPTEPGAVLTEKAKVEAKALFVALAVALEGLK
jgi:hypothetical protein